MLYICISRWTILKRAFLISVVNSVPLISATVVTALLAPQSFRHQPSVEQNIKLQSWAWLRVKESTVWAKSDKRHQIKNLLSRFPLLWCLMKTECVGSDFCCWPLIYPLHHLPSLESSLNASSLPVLNEQIIYFFNVDEVWVSAAGTVFTVCSASAHANYPSLSFLPKKWETTCLTCCTLNDFSWWKNHFQNTKC